MEIFDSVVFNSIYQFIHMNIFYLLCIFKNNGSMVDLGWPSGFFIMSIYFLITGKALLIKRLLICIPLFFAGLRFILLWIFERNHFKYEDKRWELWRERWRRGEGWFGIKSVPVNFFFFYHAQSITNASFSIPLYLITNSKYELSNYEVIGFLIWIISFICENIADYQLTKFKSNKKNLNSVCRVGFWAYSRHPNYFFEFLLWFGIFIMTFPNLTQTWEYFVWIGMPYGTYYFLVEFTGIPMCEKQSLKNRGDIYQKYQEEVNMFFPWFPKKNNL